MSHLPSSPVLGIVIVAFNSADVLLDCLESLLASEGVALRIVIVDNCSSDATVTVLRDWAAGGQPYAPAKDLPFDVPTYVKPLPLHGDAGRFGGHRLCLIEAKVNGGFAAGVNLGLAHLTTQPELDRFWVLNPDSVAAPGSAVAFASCPAPAQGFAFMGGRVLYLEDPNIIQIDGGTIDRRTGVTGNIGLYAPHISTPPQTSTDGFYHGGQHGRLSPLLRDGRPHARGLFPVLRRGRLGLEASESAADLLPGCGSLPPRRYGHRVTDSGAASLALLALFQTSRADTLCPALFSGVAAHGLCLLRCQGCAVVAERLSKRGGNSARGQFRSPPGG